MAFSSLIFLCIFLPAFLAAYYAVPEKWRNSVALAASLLFYAWGAPRFVFALIALSGIDYVISKRLPEACGPVQMRKRWLGLAISVNVAVLVYAKYCNFFVAELNTLLGTPAHDAIRWPDVLLPLGISFFTFQKLSYLIDVYRGITVPAASFGTYLLYVSLFPQLIAGPIVRYHDIAQQLITRVYTSACFASGMWRFSLGLAKKVLIADGLAPIADAAFSAGGPATAAGAWVGVFTYAFQIYFDFSGYSDMAVGLGRMMGLRILENFDTPYRSRSFTEFWRRWHISLSAWMREYLYVPLGGNRTSPIRMALNLWIVFLISGLWHGAAWTFLIWGCYHGVFLSLDKWIEHRRIPRLPDLTARPLTFLLVAIGWVWFRAPDLNAARAYLARLFTHGAESTTGVDVLGMLDPGSVLLIAIAALGSFAPRRVMNPLRALRVREPIRDFAQFACSCVMTGTCMIHLVASGFTPFIYFRF